jgi:NAD(P)-dependent dehydrogenase (short-subunit alcohol dehydrogenase family)
MTDLVQGALSGNDRVIATLDPGTEQPPIEPDWQQNLHYVVWNRRSPLSARNLINDGLNRFERIDEVFVVFAPEGNGTAFHELSSADIEENLDVNFKGYLFLLKELFGLFQRQKSGTISLVHYEGITEIPAPLYAAAAGAFRTLVSALFAQYRNEQFHIRGFHSSVPQTKDFASYLLGITERPEKTSGRWFKYSGRAGLFSFGRK